MENRRILILTTTFESPLAGTEGQIRTLLEHLPPPWKADLWVLSPKRFLPWDDLPFPVRCLEMTKLGGLRTLVRLPFLAREIRRHGFLAIHTFMADAGLVGCVAGRLAGVPVFVSRRDLGIWQTPRLLRAARFANRFATRFVANCEAVRAHTIRTEKVAPERISVIENGLCPERFHRPARPGLRRELDLPAGAPLIGMVGNYRELKRHTDLVDALALLTGEVANVHLLLVGRGLEPALAHAARRGVDRRVRLLGLREDVVPILKHLDVGVLCSDSEGLSNAILEYLACGLPVVATRVGGNPDLVADGENGFLVAPGDAVGLARALARVLGDPAQKRAMGEVSRRRFAGRFTAQRMVAETVAMYASALE